MKRILTFICIIVLSNVAFSQEKDSDNDRAYFVALYTVGESWDAEKPPQEQAYFKEHSAHLSDLRKASKIVLGARYSDTGIIILKVKDEAEAQELINSDTAIQNKLFQVQIFPYYPFYKGCVE